MRTVLVSSANSNICVGPGSISMDWYFSCLFSCLVIFIGYQTLGILPDWVLDVFYIPINIRRLCSRYLLGTPHNDPESWGFPVWLLGEQVLFLTTSEFWGLLLSPIQMSLACLGMFLTRMYCWVLQENFLQTSRLSLSSPKDYIVNSSYLSPWTPSFIFPALGPHRASLGSPPGASAWGLSWGSKAGQPCDSHPKSHVLEEHCPLLPHVRILRAVVSLILSCLWF